MSSENEFQVVTHKHRKRKYHLKSKIPVSELSQLNINYENEDSSPERISKFISKLKLYSDEIFTKTKFGNLVSEIINSSDRLHFDSKISVEEIICYGLGCISDNFDSRYQLAFLDLLCKKLSVAPNSVYLFDPIFCKFDLKIIETMGFNVLKVDEQGKRQVSVENGRSLFLLPYCDKFLYNNLLWANWTKEQLKNILIFGNSFQYMCDRIPERIMKKYSKYIWDSCNFMSEYPFGYGELYDRFHDMSLHSFQVEKMKDFDFHVCPEPTYQEEDFFFFMNK